MDTKTAKRLLKDLVMAIDNNDISEESFTVILKNYIEVK